MTAAADWTGRVGDVWAGEWRRTDRSLAALEPHLEDAILQVAPQTGRFLDIGSGAGTTGLAIAAARPAAQVIGVDLSSRLVDVAAARLAGTAHPRFRAGDVVEEARALAPVDLFFSRHGVMFFADPVGAFTALRRAAAPGAPLIFTCPRGREDNAFAGTLAAAVLGADPAEPASHAPGPFAFADPERVTAVLRAAGWALASTAPIDFEYVAGEGDDPIADAVSFLTKVGPLASAMRAAKAGRRQALRARLTDALKQWHRGDSVALPASAWLCTAYATREPA